MKDRILTAIFGTLLIGALLAPLGYLVFRDRLGKTDKFTECVSRYAPNWIVLEHRVEDLTWTNGKVTHDLFIMGYMAHNGASGNLFYAAINCAKESGIDYDTLYLGWTTIKPFYGLDDGKVHFVGYIATIFIIPDHLIDDIPLDPESKYLEDAVDHNKILIEESYPYENIVAPEKSKYVTLAVKDAKEFFLSTTQSAEATPTP